MPNQAFVVPQMPPISPGSMVQDNSQGPKLQGKLYTSTDMKTQSSNKQRLNMRSAGKGKPNADSSTPEPTKKGKRININMKQDDSYNGAVLINLPKPAPVSFKSGLDPKVTASDFVRPIEGRCSTFHMTACEIHIPTLVGNPLKQYYNEILSFAIQSKMQKEVNFNVLQGNEFTEDKIQSALNAGIRALQVYHYYAGWQVLAANYKNNNDAISKANSLITPDMNWQLTNLKQKLANVPVPPIFANYVRYMMSVFSSGKEPGCALLRIAPTEPQVVSGICTMIRANDITVVNGLLDDPENERVFNLISRVTPSWQLGDFETIPDTPQYDPQFCTIFANLPFVTTFNNVPDYNPKVNDITQSILYNSYVNDLDGGALASTSAFTANTFSGLTPGLIKVYSNVNSRRSWYIIGGVKTWHAVTTSPFLNRSRKETYYNTEAAGNPVASGHLFGALMVDFVAMNTVSQIAESFLLHLFSLDKIQGKNKTLTRR